MPGIFPSKDEIELVDATKRKIASAIEKCLLGVDYELKFAGSTELGTFVSGEYDIDAFVVSRDKDKAYDMVSKCIPGVKKEGELDIWHTTQDGVEVDIVVMDPTHPKTQTLEHTDYYKKVLDEDKRKEIVKAKVLMKNRGCYSAELGGITGIALTELISKYGNLEKACEVLEKDSGIHLADPTKPERNLLASVTPVRWDCVKSACREYRETKKLPTERYTERSFEDEMRSKAFTVLKLPRQDDTAIDFSRALSACKTCANELVNLEKDVEKPECNAFVRSNTLVAFKAPERLTEEKEVRISKAIMEDAVKAFMRAHPDAREEDGSLVARVRRRVTEPRAWLEKCISDKFKH